MMPPYAHDCSPEWRRLVSCHIDGELNELDAARLNRHLAGCADCAEWAESASSVAELLRGREHVVPERTLTLQVLRRRPRPLHAAASVASVAAAAVAALVLQLPTQAGPAASGRGHALAAGSLTACVWCGAPRVLMLQQLATRLPATRTLLNPARSA